MSKKDTLIPVDVPERVKKSLEQFFETLGREIPTINDDTDLIRDLSATSDEGVDFAIDLCETLGGHVPNHFNPFVHESGRRGMRFRELAEWSVNFVSALKE